MIRAAALGRSIIVTEGAGSARGAAALAASAIVDKPLSEVAERFAGVRSVVDPDAALVATMEERYRMFLTQLPSD